MVNFESDGLRVKKLKQVLYFELCTFTGTIYSSQDTVARAPLISTQCQKHRCVSRLSTYGNTFDTNKSSADMSPKAN